ncbi:Ger(x)C family spore germination protein [Virgibacillus halodenitrificans]|uniref:Ger(x)C family spore germination protein n=1 Tax=Virgibacillus halodenitrificans TaxID=1482 RepID=UPI0002E8B1CD|nr:Ger(x)C family spore germination protein [Virgibacillus halodenitrificans]MEC2158721.1 Ger(x)C family spore germination protein [Virgibacillus halodenitrificans]MYL44266.1 Ger(x)C family spore germination protein [Virgibacillus halodenitrificans]
MKRLQRRLLLLIPVMLLSLTGCWDQQMLKENRLIYGIGYDPGKDNKLRETVVIRSVPKDPKAGIANEIVSVNGTTIREQRSLLNKRISGDFAEGKARMILLSEDLAKIDIYPFLDSFYRDPRSPLGAKLGVVKGSVEEIYRIQQKEQTLIIEYIEELLDNEERNGTIPKQSIQTVCTQLFDEGRDFGLPLLRYDEENEGVELDGLALFNKRSYTGENLTGHQSKMMMILAEERGKNIELTFKVDNQEKENWLYNYVSVIISDADTKKNITYDASAGQFIVDLHIQLEVQIQEYASDHLYKKEKADELEKVIKERLYKDADEVITKLQEVNSDVFGYGRDLLAYHAKQLSQRELHEDYFKKLKINPTFQVTITETGGIY